MANQEILLEVKNVVKRFAGVVALKGVHFKIHRGEILALIGENGAGKSTLMKIVQGLYHLDEGEMFLKGKIYSPRSAAEALSKGISMIHQEMTLIPDMTVEENIWIGREDKFTQYGIINKKMRTEATRKLMAELGINIDCNKEVGKLSVSSMQLVEVARAVSYDSDLIIMDEPTSAISTREVEQLFEIIRNLARQGKGIIFISHKLEELMAVCDNFVVLRDGEFVSKCPVKDTSKELLINQMVGREVKNLFPKEKIEIGEVVFEVKDLHRIGIFKDINFNVRKGEILGFCGLMGAGRTEIMQGIFGIDRLDGGTILLKGKEIKNKSTKQAIKNGLAMVTEDRLRRGLIHKLSVRVNTSIAYLDKITKCGFVNRKKEISDYNKMVNAIGIKVASSEQESGVLSGGNQQKVIIAKWLLTNPEVLILDEPTRGIDVGAKAEIFKLVGELVKQGKAIIMVSSELPELIGVCDRIIVVRDGKIVAESKRDEFDDHLLMQHAFGV